MSIEDTSFSFLHLVYFSNFPADEFSKKLSSIIELDRTTRPVVDNSFLNLLLFGLLFLVYFQSILEARNQFEGKILENLNFVLSSLSVSDFDPNISLATSSGYSVSAQALLTDTTSIEKPLILKNSSKLEKGNLLKFLSF